MDMKIHHCMESSENILIMHRGKEMKLTQKSPIQQFKDSPNSYFASLYSAKKPQQSK
jgi:hypothetical protein